MDREALIAQHVEALVGLGWHWEGRGLVPGWQAMQIVHRRNVTQQNTAHCGRSAHVRHSAADMLSQERTGS